MAVPETMLPMDWAVFLLPFVSAPLSLLSSAYIVYLILTENREKNKRQSPRDHILLGMSLLDISFSFAVSFSTLPGPAVMDEILPTVGTVGTCTAQGFFVQIGLGAPFYNACLCIYYLLRVRYRVSDDYLMKWAVPLMHSTIMSFSIGSALTALILDLYNFAGVTGCWIHNADALCLDDPQYCDRGQRANEFEIYFALIHIALCFVFVTFAMILLWCTVRNTEMRASRWQVQTQESEEKKKSSLSRQTMETGLLYSLTFLSVWFPSGISSIISSNHWSTWWYQTLRVAVVTLNPLQGFFNMLIFTAPRWTPWVKQKLCCSSSGHYEAPQSLAVEFTSHGGTDFAMPTDSCEHVDGAGDAGVDDPPAAMPNSPRTDNVDVHVGNVSDGNFAASNSRSFRCDFSATVTPSMPRMQRLDLQQPEDP